MIIQGKSKRKGTGSGGVNRSSYTKRITRKGGEPAFPKIGGNVVKIRKKRGGSAKLKMLAGEKINVYDPKTKKSKVTLMKTVVENPANRHFVRRNILTKGTIVITEIGKVRITNRPSQEGHANGMLLGE